MIRARWIQPPTDLPEVAKTYWKAHAQRLFAAERLSANNVEQFRQLCTWVAIARQAADEIARDGVTVALGGAAGAPESGGNKSNAAPRKSNPAVGILLSAQREAERLMGEFGLDDTEL